MEYNSSSLLDKSAVPEQHERIVGFLHGHYTGIIPNGDVSMDSSSLWVLYVGLIFFGLLFLLALISGCAQCNAKRRSEDGQSLIEDNTPAVYIVTTGYENAAFLPDIEQI